MSDLQSLEVLIRSKRKTLLFAKDSLPVQLKYSQEDIKKIIPHRDPLLFVDKITALDYEKGLIAGERFISFDDPVFAGHFPNTPVYPGNFTLEMIGQMGLCMYYFNVNNCISIDSNAEPVAARATRIMGAYYLEPIYPGSVVTLLAQKLITDDYFASMIGQAVVDDKVAVVVTAEVIIL